MALTIPAIATELSTDPDTLGYAGLSDIDAEAAINLPRYTVPGPVPKGAFADWCAMTGLRRAIEDHAKNSASPLSSIALRTLDYLQGGETVDIDFSLPNNVAMLDAWVTAGAITAAQETTIINLKQIMISRAQKIGGTRITAYDINLARSA